MTQWAITGASGYIGGELARYLRGRGESVRALTRADGDVRDRSAMERGFSGVEMVVHCAAYVHRTPRNAADAEECRSVNVDGTRAVLEAAMKAGARAFIFISSANVYGAYDRPVREDDDCHPDTPYGRAKLEAESLVRAAARTDFSTIVLRPAVVIGAGAPGNFLRLAKIVRTRFFPLVDGGTALKSMVPIETLMAAIRAAADAHQRISGKVFNVTGGDPLTMREIASLTAEALGIRVRFVPTPRVALHFVDLIARTLPPLAPVRRMINTFVQTAALDGSKLANALRFVPPVTLREAVRSSVRRRRDTSS